MQYEKTGDAYLVRMDRGEEITACLTDFCLETGVMLAEVSAIGAVDRFTVGNYDVERKEYRSNEFSGSYEIVSLSGSVTEMDGKCYIHLHMAAADESGRTVGGHLNRAVVSATCEMIVRVMPGAAGRTHDEATGLNLLDLGE